MSEFSFTYRAFISYSHADHDHAVWLHKALERYRVPRRLAGADGRKRLGRVFRDEEELAAAAELGPKIEAALKGSDVLIVVCSPRSAKSKWVNQEIEAFKRLGREHRVFALIAEGTPHGAPDAAGAETECFPPALKVTADGGVAEPLAVDVRKFGREDAVLRLVAGMLDVGYDDLRQRHERQRQGELVRTAVISATGVALVAAAVTAAWIAANNLATAAESKASQTAREATDLFRTRQYNKAVLMSLAADPAAQRGIIENWLRPKGFSDARAALAQAHVRNAPLWRFTGHQLAVTSLAVSPDGKTVATVSDDGYLKLWPAQGGAPRASYGAGDLPKSSNFTDAMSSVAWSPDGVFVGVVTGDVAKVVRADSGRLYSEYDCRARADISRHTISSIAFTADGKSILLGCRNPVLKQLDQQGEPLVFEGHADEVTSLDISRDGSLVLSGSKDGTAKVWSIAGGAALTTIEVHAGEAAGGRVTAVAVSDDNLHLAAASSQGFVKRWLFTRESLKSVMNYTSDRFAPGAGVPTSVSFAKDGSETIASFEDGSARTWDQAPNDLRDIVQIASVSNGISPLTTARFLPDGAILTAARDGTATLWPAGANLPLATFGGQTRTLSSVAFGPGDRTARSMSNDGAFREWRIDTNEEIEAYSASGGFLDDDDEEEELPDLFATAMSPDGQFLATGSQEGLIQLTRADAKAEDKPISFLAYGQPIYALALSRDGELVLSSDREGWIFLWSASQRKFVRQFKDKNATARSVAISPDKTMIAAGLESGAVVIWSVEEKAPVARLEGHQGWVTSVSFSPDGQKIVSAADDTAKVWSVTGGEALATLRGHAGAVAAAVFSPDGQRVLTGSQDGSAMLWLAAGGSAIATFAKNQDQRDAITMDNNIYAVAFSSDGRSVVTGSSDHSVNVWPIDPIALAPASQQIAMACEKLKATNAVMQLTPDDIQTFPILRGANRDPCGVGAKKK